MEWEPEQQDLAALGLAGICRDTSRVVRQVIVLVPSFANLGPMLLSALLLANTAACSVLSPRVASVLDDGSSLRLVADLAASYTVGLWLDYTAAYVLCVASLYRTGDNLLAVDLPAFLFKLKEDHPVVKLLPTFLFVAVPFLVVYTSLPVAIALLRVRLEVETFLPLRLLGWACAAYVAVVGHLACVVSLLEDVARFDAVRRSRELLAGNFGAAACVFVTLDGCVLAVLKGFTVLVIHDALGLGLGFQLAAGAAMFVVLYAVLAVVLVAQPVVYIVCRNHQQGIVDKAHLA